MPVLAYADYTKPFKVHTDASEESLGAILYQTQDDSTDKVIAYASHPLTYVLTTAKLDATGQRWVASLANYNFTITYHSGKHNIDADALSRVLWNITTTDQPLLIKSALIRGTQGESFNPYDST